MHRKGELTGNNQAQFCIFLSNIYLFIYLFIVMEPLCVAKHETDLVHRKEGITGVNQGQFCVFVNYIYLFIYLLIYLFIYLFIYLLVLF